jgi:hypothetical protein
MKKALVILLILAVAGGLFAQDFTIGGKIDTGLKFSGGDGQAAWAEGYHDDHGPTRVELNGNYAAENYGAKIGIRSNVPGDLVPFSSIFIYNAYVWSEFLNDIINVKAGLIDDAAWNTGGPEDFNVSNGGGLRIEVKPIAGLNVGVMLNAINQNADPFTDGFGAKFEYFFLETGIGAKYEHDIVDVALGVKLDSKGDAFIGDEGYVKGTAVGKLLAGGGLRDKDNEEIKDSAGVVGIFGVNVKAVPKLTAQVEGKIYNLGAFSDIGWTWFIENFAYQVLDPLSVGIELRQNMFGAEFAKRLVVFREAADDKAGPWIKFKPYVTYAVLPALDVGLEVGFALQPKVTQYELNFRPKITYKLADNAKIVTYYDFNTSKPDYSGAESVNMTTVQINLEWSF